ncbi:MAG: MFS transporter [Chloroflexi bacterium]|nr:MFS transporter [Chloroflexota bacterium]
MTTSPEPEAQVSTFGALRSKDFRRFWIGFVISVSGQQMLWMTEGWLIYELSGSKLLLGANGLAQAIPATLLTLFGGVMADKLDQRRLLILLQMLQMTVMGVMAALAITEVIQAWHVIAGAFVMSSLGAFENPARQAMFPLLVERKAMTSAVSLNATIHPGTRVLGPVVGGFTLATVVGATSSAMIAGGVVFTITAVGFLVYAGFLRTVHLPAVHRATGRNMLQNIRDGLAFVKANGVFAWLIGMAYFGMFFALSLSVLFPVFAKDILDVGPSGLGFMYTAMGVGSLAGAFSASSLASAFGPRKTMIGGGLVLGSFLLMFGLSTWYPLSLVFLALTGVGGSVYNVGIQSTMHMLVPNEFRGRVMGLWGMTHTSIRPMGEMQFAGVAALVAAPFALALGGGILLAFVVLVVAHNRHIKELRRSAERV